MTKSKWKWKRGLTIQTRLWEAAESQIEIRETEKKTPFHPHLIRTRLLSLFVEKIKEIWKVHWLLWSHTALKWPIQDLNVDLFSYSRMIFKIPLYTFYWTTKIIIRKPVSSQSLDSTFSFHILRFLKWGWILKWFLKRKVMWFHCLRIGKWTSIENILIKIFATDLLTLLRRYAAQF